MIFRACLSWEAVYRGFGWNGSNRWRVVPSALFISVFVHFTPGEAQLTTLGYNRGKLQAE